MAEDQIKKTSNNSDDFDLLLRSDRGDESGKRKFPKKLTAVIIASLAVLLVAWLKAEDIVSSFIKVPPAPSEPDVPVEPGKPAYPKFDKRTEPIDFVIGVDNTKSPIANKLGFVKNAIIDFIKSNGDGGLQAGDFVSICKISDRANCQRFFFPGDKESMIDFVNSIAAEGMETKLSTAIEDIIRFIRSEATKATAMVTIWTDAKNEEERDVDVACSQAQPCPDIKVVIPDEGFKGDAKNFINQVRKTYEGNVESKLAKTGEDFNSLLDKFNETLTKLAQTISDAKVKTAYEQRLKEYQQGLVEYEKQLKKAEEEYQKALSEYGVKNKVVIEKIESVKRTIRYIVLVLGGLITAIGIALIRSEMRPRLYGYIEDIRDPQYVKKYDLPHKKNKHVLNLPNGSFELMPTGEGVMYNDKILHNGDELTKGVNYFLKGYKKPISPDIGGSQRDSKNTTIIRRKWKK